MEMVNEVKSTVVGRGLLTWARHERVSDRYGTVMLIDTEARYLPLEEGLDGRKGMLTATVVTRGLSGHIGDLFRGFAPPRSVEELPPIGSVYRIGSGTAFYDRVEDAPCIGVEPDDGRDADWLDPRTLYLLHEQEVELRFIEEST